MLGRVRIFLWGFVWWVRGLEYFWVIFPEAAEKQVHSKNIKAMANFIDKLKAAFSLESPSERELRQTTKFEEYYQNRYPAYNNFLLVKLAHRFDQPFVLALDENDKLIRILDLNAKEKVFRPAIYTVGILHYSLNNQTHRYHPNQFPKDFNGLGMMIKFKDNHGFEEWIIKICEEKDNFSENKRSLLLNKAICLAKFIGYDKVFDENKYDEYVEQIANWKEKIFNNLF